MRWRKPPAAATWLLENFPPGERNEALAGDLLEEFHYFRRSEGWYWRQVLSAVAIECSREMLNHQIVLVFAVLWSMLAPEWLLIIARFEKYSDLSGRLGLLDWPWSSICDWGLLLGANLLFIWAGITLYLIPHLWVKRNLRLRALSRGLLASIPILIAVWAALVVLPKYFLVQNEPIARPSVISLRWNGITNLASANVEHAPPAESHAAKHGDNLIASFNNPGTAIADMRPSAILVRVPFFLCVFCTLWEATSRLGDRRRRFAA